MATLGAIRDALKSTLAGVSGLHVYDTVEDAVNFPAAIVQPDPGGDGRKTVDYVSTMGRGTYEWAVNIYLLVPKGTDVGASQKILDAFMSGSGPRSIPAILWANPSLGLADTDCTVKHASGYGGRFDVGATNCAGVVIRTTIISPGTA